MDKNTHEYAKTLSDVIAKALDSKKALDIAVLSVEKQTALADYFVLATGTSSTHIKALADEAEFKVNEELQVTPRSVEGIGDKSWILIDYDCVIVHVFTREAREFYKLDKLWADAGVNASIPND